MGMAEILMLTPQLPYPPQQGTSLRNFHMLRALAEHHRITLLSFVEAGSPVQLEPLRRYCHVLPPVPAPTRPTAERLRQLFTNRRPDVALRLASGEFDRALNEALSAHRYDAVQIEGIELAATIGTIRAHPSAPRIVLDCHNAETALQRRALRTDLGQPSRWPAALYSALQIGRLARFERWALEAADAVMAVSETDRDRLLAMIEGSKPITVIPNTIDVGEYATAAPADPALRYDLVFTGKMDYRPNVDGILWFAVQVWPGVRQRRPQTTFAIVGQRPHPRLEPLRALAGVTLTGKVPEVQPYLAGASVYVIPLRIGSGTRLKLIEAMAAGKAVISTTIGAEGFAISPGDNIILADQAAEWVEAIVALLDHPERRDEMAAAARAFAARFDWRQIVPPLREIYPDEATAG
ncbi:putative glycosyltransferase [Candidatus Promineifilum breve]|uniref:Glycosyltransferase n=2 Tax=Candidatus Promineifilum breve TaxID=1806508 RepID=A0A160T0H7_9CHLR|nr:putative glycosyltransferase [Candidatus Promineifilum breve]